MADRLATPLGTESEVLVSEELLVAQDDIQSIGKNVVTLLVEFDQQAFDANMYQTQRRLSHAIHEERLGSRA